MRDPELLAEIHVHNELGEGVIWDSRRRAAWWTDILGRRIYRYAPATGRLDEWPTPERLSCFATVADRDDLIAGFESGFAFFDPGSGRVDWIARVEDDNPATRLNDGRADRQGRFWAGTMVEHRTGDAVPGALYCLDRDRRMSRHVDELAISNGLCWSPDSAVMYHTDTPTGRIDRYAFDAASGIPGNRSTFATADPGCWPDGSTVDAEGFVWNAQWGGSRVIRYSPSGEPALVVPVPVSQPSCVAFGGDAMNLLFVTSARQDLDTDELAAQPGAGNLFIYETEFVGLADCEYAPR